MLTASAVRPSRLSRRFQCFLASALAASFLSGILLWWGQSSLPQQFASPFWLHPCRVLHGVLNAVICLLFGSLWARHIPVGWKMRANRPSGVGMVLLIGGLIATGLILYYAGGEGVRRWGLWVHEGLGTVLPVWLWVHWRAGRRWGAGRGDK